METRYDNVIRTLEELVINDPDTRIIHDTGGPEDRTVLVLGGAGFLGSTVTRRMIEEGYNVRVLDRFIYEKESLRTISASPRLQVFMGDIRDTEYVESLMQGVDTVVNLAAIVGDEACRIDPEATWEINVEAVGAIAAAAGRCGVQRIIHASTCSTYGKNGNGLLSEDSDLLPLSLYAESKVESERVLFANTDGGNSPAVSILRLSTLFGFSRRPRFDLVVNTLTGHAWKKGKITIFGGEQWRPLLHVGDAARAIMKIASGDISKVGGKIYNTGGESMNLTIRSIGEKIREIIPTIEMDVETSLTDERDYRVDFSRIRNDIGFIPRYTISNGIYELIHALDNTRGMDPERPVFSNYKWLSGDPAVLERTMETVVT